MAISLNAVNQYHDLNVQAEQCLWHKDSCHIIEDIHWSLGAAGFGV